MYDPVAVQTLREAAHYSDMCNEAERIEAYSASQERTVSVALNAIRKADMTPAVVEMILNTLACRMAACGFSDSDVQIIDEAAQVIA